MATGRTELDQPISAFEAPEISDKEMAEHKAGIMANAFERTGLCEVVDIKAAIGQIHLLCRVKKENERRWVHELGRMVLKAIKKHAEGSMWAKDFFLMSPDDSMRYAWVFSLQARDLEEVTRLVCDAIDEVVPPMEVLEAPLIGPRAPAGAGPMGGKRGAAPIRGK